MITAAAGETPGRFRRRIRLERAAYRLLTIAHVITYAAHRRTLVTGALYTAGQTELDDDPLYYAPLMP